MPLQTSFQKPLPRGGLHSHLFCLGFVLTGGEIEHATQLCVLIDVHGARHTVGA